MTRRIQNLLAQMTKDASRIIKGNDPKALIGCASVLPRDSSGGMKRAKKYLSALKKKDAKNWCGIDFVACHIYPEPGKACEALEGAPARGSGHDERNELPDEEGMDHRDDVRAPR